MAQAQLKLKLKKVPRKPSSASASKKPTPPAATKPERRKVVRLTAADLAEKQREISVSEFFTKNRHLLGFDSPAKALLTTVKEAVDNALDACEEAGILPDVLIEIQSISETRYRVAVQDNGPGIVKAQIPKIFGQLLYGSKFHRLRQSRGQQGIGISAAGMYGQLTTGKPITVISRVGANKPAHKFDIQIDTRRNAPVVTADDEVKWEPEHGTRVEIEIEATYKKGRHSVDGYVEQTAMANPHAAITYVAPDGERLALDRVAAELPKEPLEIKPHPHGVELGILLKMLHETKARNLKGFLSGEFSRVSPAEGCVPLAEHDAAEGGAGSGGGPLQRDPGDQADGASVQRPLADRRGAAPDRAQEAGGGAILCRDHTLSIGLPRQPVPGRGGARLWSR